MALYDHPRSRSSAASSRRPRTPRASTPCSAISGTPACSAAAGTGVAASNDTVGPAVVASVVSVVRVKITVRWVIANSTTGGAAATDAARSGGTSASAATIAWIAFAATDTIAAPISSVHGYQAVRCPASATTATVATTISPSTISGHAHACPEPIPERAARSAKAVKESQNPPAAMHRPADGGRDHPKRRATGAAITLPAPSPDVGPQGRHQARSCRPHDHIPDRDRLLTELTEHDRRTRSDDDELHTVIGHRLHRPVQRPRARHHRGKPASIPAGIIVLATGGRRQSAPTITRASATTESFSASGPLTMNENVTSPDRTKIVRTTPMASSSWYQASSPRSDTGS